MDDFFIDRDAGTGRIIAIPFFGGNHPVLFHCFFNELVDIHRRDTWLYDILKLS